MSDKSYKNMIIKVAQAIGKEMCQDVAFVGGCTTGLLLTDDFSLEQVRHTNDVDLIIHVVSIIEWNNLQDKLRDRGFKDNTSDESPICAMYLGELRVDFMPDSSLLGFSNRWYEGALRTASNYQIADEVSIRLVNPVYFVATKLEAYLSRGKNDPLSSQDIEDILNLFDGRHTLAEEIGEADSELKNYISEQLTNLQNNQYFEYALQSAAKGDSQRENWIIDRIILAIKWGGTSNVY